MEKGILSSKNGARASGTGLVLRANNSLAGVAGESGCASGAVYFSSSVPASCARAGPRPATSSSKNCRSASLAPSIHVSKAWANRKTWMAGTSPAMMPRRCKRKETSILSCLRPRFLPEPTARARRRYAAASRSSCPVVEQAPAPGRAHTARVRRSSKPAGIRHWIGFTVDGLPGFPRSTTSGGSR
jgi:hypothetical protein